MPNATLIASRIARLLFTYLLAWAWVGQPSLARAQQPAPGEVTQEQLSQAADKLEAEMAKIEASLKDARRDYFDPEAILELVGREPDALFAWVRDRTHYLPYAGSLRGPRGVLMERAGNALDRSLLLATLLRSAGHEARLARVTLSPEQAADLAGRVKLPPEGWLFADDPEIKQKPAEAVVADDAAKAVVVRSQALAEDAATRFERDVALIGKTLGATLQKGEARPMTVDADHWWVQRKTADGWIDLDPLAADAKPGLSVAPPRETAELDPKTGLLKTPGVYHEVQLRVVIEKWQDGKVSEQQVLSHVVRPSELAGEQVTLKQVPVGWKDDDIPYGTAEATAKVSEKLAAHKEWWPTLIIGKTTLNDKGFNIAGDKSEKPGMGSAIAGALGGALRGGLLGGDEPAGPAVLTAQWIEYELHAPGQPPRVIRKATFDLLGDAARKAGGKIPEPKLDTNVAAGRALALLSPVDTLILGGRISPAWVHHSAGQQLLDSRALLVSALRRGAQADFRTIGQKLGTLHFTIGVLHAWAIARHLYNADAEAIYLDRMNVATHSKEYRLSPAGEAIVREGIDIIENPVAPRPGVADPVRVVMQQGVADTVSEAVALQARKSTENVSEMVARAAAQSATWSAVSTMDDPAVTRLNLPPEAAANLQKDLSSGAVVLLPSKPIEIDGKPIVGWYRVDPKTGNTLGMLSDGEGAAGVEYVAMLVQIVISVTVVWGCGGFAQGVSGAKLLGCTICGLLLGLLAYFFVAATLGAAAGAAGAFATGAGGGWAGLGIGTACNVISGGMS